jgi:hypothetical protein
MNPKIHVLIEVLWIPQPAQFIDVMAKPAADGIVFSCMVDGCDELRKHITIGCSFQVFPDGPPAIIINLFNGRIRTFKQRNIGRQPGIGLFVGNMVNNQFRINAAEIVYMAFQFGQKRFVLGIGSQKEKG